MREHALFKAFVTVAVLEALSWAGLLTGMYFKYYTDLGDLGVRVFGPLHGGIFVLYVLLTLAVARACRWPGWLTLVGLASSVPPFATLAFELGVTRSKRVPRSSDARSELVDTPPGAASGVRS